ncbi:MAG TPA: carboxypeptidase regulatory-like domain-containing protein, partial [Gemmatirosa sp.]
MTGLHARTAACVAGSLISLGAAAAHAQSIVGTVASGRGPVVGARVRIAELDRVMQTDARGQFTFPDRPRGTYRVFVTAPGYAAASRTVAVVGPAATSATFALTLSAVPLDEVVVSASPVARPATEASQSVT